MMTHYRSLGLIGSAAIIIVLLSGVALAQSMKPGINLSPDKPALSADEQASESCHDAYKSAIEKLPEKKNRPSMGEHSVGADDVAAASGQPVNTGGAPMRHRQTRPREHRNSSWADLCFHFEPMRGTQKMPLLFYFPLIVWMGPMESRRRDARSRQPRRDHRRKAKGVGACATSPIPTCGNSRCTSSSRHNSVPGEACGRSGRYRDTKCSLQ